MTFCNFVKAYLYNFPIPPALAEEDVAAGCPIY